jgi:hypothetical protein
MLSPYTSQHLETLAVLTRQLKELEAAESEKLRGMLGPYLAYREETAHFFRDHLIGGCRRRCLAKNSSGGCGRAGVNVLFSDIVVVHHTAAAEKVDDLGRALEGDRGGKNCAYLGREGCHWAMKPIACEMFLCDELKEEIFAADDGLRREWEQLRAREKEFTKPDRPVLFDDLERFFIEKGVENPLMYFHHSPGLLRLKRKHNVGRLERIRLIP